MATTSPTINRAVITCALALFVGAGVSASMTGCRAPEEDRLGYRGESCYADSQCEEPLVCNAGRCVGPDTPGSITCEQMCDRVVNICENSYENCAESCRRTIAGWSDAAATTFGRCFLGQTEPTLTCEDAMQNTAPSFCYQQIPLPEDRQERCDAFVDTAREVATDTGARLDSKLTGLRQRCYIFARTRPLTQPASSDQIGWEETADCVRATEMLTDAEVIDCYNTVFSLSSATCETDGCNGDASCQFSCQLSAPPSAGLSPAPLVPAPDDAGPR